jgi:hypothetical protein
VDLDQGRGLLAPQQTADLTQALFFPYLHIGTLIDTTHGVQRRQLRDDLVLPLFHPGAQKLADQELTVTIHDQPGQAVTLGGDQSIGVGLAGNLQGLAPRQGSLDTSLKERRIDRLLGIEGPDTHPDLRGG